jgi:membrane protein required for colicin V production
MQPYDLLMLAILIGATVFGFYKGMAWQVASVAALVASYFVALRFSEALAPLFGQTAPWNRFGAMALTYLITSLLIWMLFRFVRNFIDRVKLREFDRQIGAIFGAAKGLLLCIAITFFGVTLSGSARESILHSHSGFYIAQFLAKADTVMPRELHDFLDPYLNRLERGLDPNQPSETAGELGGQWR